MYLPHHLGFQACSKMARLSNALAFIARVHICHRCLYRGAVSFLAVHGFEYSHHLPPLASGMAFVAKMDAAHLHGMHRLAQTGPQKRHRKDAEAEDSNPAEGEE